MLENASSACKMQCYSMKEMRGFLISTTVIIGTACERKVFWAV
jgi:hypothetical protein